MSGPTTPTTDVRRGTSGTSRDVPIFVQFHKKFVQLMTYKKKKKVAKKIADLVKKYRDRKRNKVNRPKSRALSSFKFFPK